MWRRSDALILDDSDIDRVHAAITAYFRAAGALAQASILARLAAIAARAAPEDTEGESDEAWLLDRAATYRDKSDLMSTSGTALLSHAWDWIDGLDQTDVRDQKASLVAFARAIEEAAGGYAEVVEALTATPLSSTDAYHELLEELRRSVRFLQMEAAAFDEVASEED